MASVQIRQDFEGGFRRRSWSFHVDVGYSSDHPINVHATGYVEYERESKRHKWKQTLEYVPSKQRPNGYSRYTDVMPEPPPDSLALIKADICARMRMVPLATKDTQEQP